MMFLARADVDLRYVEVREMGRTANATIDSTTFDSQGRALRVGTNQIGRYAIHFHHNFGPAAKPANGFQFTLIGNSVIAPAKWGITIHNTHYGLVRDNVVYNSRGASIVTEDGNESFNVFDHNFAVRSIGSGDATPRGGYGGGGPDPGTEGSAFWFSGPNNYVRNNVAANADAFGFSLAGPATEMRVPAAAGADMACGRRSIPPAILKSCLDERSIANCRSRYSAESELESPPSVIRRTASRDAPLCASHSGQVSRSYSCHAAYDASVVAGSASLSASGPA